MNFEWSSEQNALYDSVIKDTNTKLNPIVSERGLDQYFGRVEWRSCGRIGLLGLSVPENHGGMGLDFLTTARLVQAFGFACRDAGLVFATSAHLFACVMPILEYASDELKEALLPGLCSGELIGANAATEAEAGSDIFSMQTSAVRDGDFYILNGAKSFITNGPIADVFIVYAVTNPANGFLGVTAFIVKKDTPGLISQEPFEKLGLKSIPSNWVCFEDCRVPVQNRIGEEGQGGVIFNHSMQWERCGLFAGFLGLMQYQLDTVVSHARKRRQFGKRIGKNQSISHRIADMKLRLEAASLLLYKACWVLGKGGNAALESSMAKLAVSEAAVQSSIDAIRLFGGSGYMAELGIHRGIQDTLSSLIASGTSEMLRDIIARELRL